MTAQAEARQLVELIAGPVRLGENVKAALARVARLTGLGDRRVRGIWNGEARRIEAEEMDRLRRAALDASTLEDVDRAYRAHLARLRACREILGHGAVGQETSRQEALRVPAADAAGRVDHAELGLAGAQDRPLDRGGRR
ncbi:hypothetical protein [Methylobacterium indicum]|uniref:Uncharacterized protein n=1 Tax=Methylobacterium indicum TaxID=1775910 RepID=A0A8H8WYN9_9HYPH|nr:hypothetical protein [Methylobacterium indicum]BCM86864.1 hypothetical protein mvi_53250 [Methylobacterium indicum]